MSRLKNQRPESPVTPALNNYLLQIYRLQLMEGEVHVTHLSAFMGVTKPSVSRAIQKLTEYRLVFHTPYGPLTLTPKGLALAAMLWEKQKVIEQLLRDVMGPEAARREALNLVCSLKGKDIPFQKEAIS